MVIRKRPKSVHAAKGEEGMDNNVVEDNGGSEGREDGRVYFPDPVVEEEENESEDDEILEEVKSPSFPDYESQEEGEEASEKKEGREAVPSLLGDYEDYYNDPIGDDGDQAPPETVENEENKSVSLGASETLLGAILSLDDGDGDSRAKDETVGSTTSSTSEASPRRLDNDVGDDLFLGRTPYPVGDGSHRAEAKKQPEDEERLDLSFVYDPFVTPFEELPAPLLPGQRSHDAEEQEEEEVLDEAVEEEDIQAAIDRLFGREEDYYDDDDHGKDDNAVGDDSHETGDDDVNDLVTDYYNYDDEEEEMPYSVHAHPPQLPVIKNRKSFFAREEHEDENILSMLADLVEKYKEESAEEVSVDFDQGLVEHPRFVLLKGKEGEETSGKSSREKELSTFYPVLSQSVDRRTGDYFPTTAEKKLSLRECLDSYYDCIQEGGEADCEAAFERCQEGAAILTMVR